ncbi:MAG: NBR1-Ig-like domain-containing protein [Anaerolineales bacterium]
MTSCVGTEPITPSSPPLASATPPPELPSTTTFTPVSVVPTTTPACTDNLQFISDVTIPDGTVVAAGSTLDKQWRVQNSGGCNWDARYSLRLISGDALGATPEQALYPARAGTQATLRILFTAPQASGNYISEWQAFDANGIPFGVSFFVKITVQ